MVSSASAVFDHALADDLVDRGFGERGGDGLASTVAFPVVGDPPGVGADVAVELTDRLEQPGLFRARHGDVEAGEDVVDGLQGAEDVAVPAEPLQPLQLRAELVGEVGRRLVRGLRARRGRWRSTPAALSGCPRGTAFRAQRNGRAERSAPRPPREKPDRGRWVHRGGLGCGMGADSGFRPSVPRLSVVPVCHGGTSCRACDWEADGAVGGRFSGRPPRVIAGAGDASAHAGRHDRRHHGGAATAATGSGVV